MAKAAAASKKLAPKKKKEVKPLPPRSSAAAKLIDAKHIGEEILDWSKVTEVDKAVYQNLKHYNYFYDHKDAFKWGLVWIKKNFTKPDQDAYMACDEWRVNTTFGGLAKMQLAGAPLTEKNLAFLQTRANELIENGKKNLAAKAQVKAAEPVVKVPVNTAQDKISEFIANVEGVIDEYHYKTVIFDAENYSVYNELKKAEATKALAQAVYDYYLPIFSEIEELVTKKTPDLVEGYRNHMPKIADQKKYMAFLKQILDDVQSYLNAKTATKVRKPRVKKAVPVEKIVGKVQYQKESLEFKLGSVDPANIVGAAEVFLFNTKYRTLTRLVAKSVDGMSIKGTTVINVQEEIVKKTLRKPEEVLPQLQSTRARASKVFVDLKTKPSAGNARINEETIILKVFK